MSENAAVGINYIHAIPDIPEISGISVSTTAEGEDGARRDGGAPRVYFARAIDGIEPEAIRLLAAEVAADLAEAGLLMVDPTLGESDGIGASRDQASNCRWLVEHELSILRECDAVLMDMSIPNRNYIGCVCEMTYAFIWKIPCIVYIGESDGRRPWLHYHATAVYKKRQQAIRRIAALFDTARDPQQGAAGA